MRFSHMLPTAPCPRESFDYAGAPLRVYAPTGQGPPGVYAPATSWDAV